MFREIRTSEKITDRFENRKNNKLFDPDKRITDEEIEKNDRFLEEEFRRASEEVFDPDKRIVVD